MAGKTLRALKYPGDVYLLQQRVAFSPDRKVLASARNGLYLWDITTGKRLAIYDRPEDIGALAFSPDGKLLAAGWKRPSGP